MYNTVIFDVDGTLLDSSQGVAIAVKKVIKDFGLRMLSEKELQLFIATSPIQKAFMEFCQVDGIMAQKCADEYRKNYINGDLYNATVYDGVVDLLKSLKNQGYNLGIASYKRQDTLDKILSHFGLDKYFQKIYGADSENKLTKKDILEKCINDLNAQPSETVFVGDSLSDGLASKDLGCKFIAVTYGFGFKNVNEINRCQPLLTVREPQEILRENYAINN